MVELAREREVRSLAVDVVKTATREATRGVVESVLAACGVDVGAASSATPGISSMDGGGGGTLGRKDGRGAVGRSTPLAASLALAMQRLCMLFTVIIALLVYMMSPSVPSF